MPDFCWNGADFMGKENVKKLTRYTNAEVYYEKLHIRIPPEEYKKITEYCERNNISKSYFMAKAAVYYVDHKEKN